MNNKQEAIAEVIEIFRDTLNKVWKEDLDTLKPRLFSWNGERDEGDEMVNELRADARFTDVRYALMAALADISLIWRVY